MGVTENVRDVVHELTDVDVKVEDRDSGAVVTAHSLTSWEVEMLDETLRENGFQTRIRRQEQGYPIQIIIDPERKSPKQPPQTEAAYREYEQQF